MPPLTLTPDPFFNRTHELRALDRAWRRPAPGGQMSLLYGRRRIGKTYLLQRFFTAGASGTEPAKPHAYFLAEQSTAPVQRAALAEQILAALPDPGISVDELAVSYNAILRHVSARCRDGERFGLVLDEFPYLVDQTPELPSIVQSWWDREGVHAQVFVVLCGSQMSAMAALVAESEPLFGRFNAGVHHLQPLRYYEAACFYRDGPLYGLREALAMYGVFGGTPRYHAMVDTARPMGEEIADLVMRPGAPLENEVRFLLGSQSVRDPAPYNAVLGAIAAGATQFGRIQQITGVERGSLSFYLRTLMDLRWLRREISFGETTDRRALYRFADPFLAFWYRFVAPLGSALQFSDADAVYRERVEPYLADHMGLSAFEGICAQWLQRYGRDRLGVSLESIARYWSRDGRVEIDLVGGIAGGGFLFGECKWNEGRPLGTGVYADLRAKVAGLPEVRWRDGARYVLFALGGFAPDLVTLANDPSNRLLLVGDHDLLPNDRANTEDRP
ncbi:MAG TPA: ATP-binding protein [Armatimonadota bacterium]